MFSQLAHFVLPHFRRMQTDALHSSNLLKRKPMLAETTGGGKATGHICNLCGRKIVEQVAYSLASNESGGDGESLTIQVLRPLVSVGVYCVTSYFLIRYAVKALSKYMDPTVSQDKTDNTEAVLKKLRDASGKSLKKESFSNLELSLANNVVCHDLVNVRWDDIAGLDDTIREVIEGVLVPFEKQDILQRYSKLIQAPKGVLLYGPPGCGKTMIAKAISRETKAVFIHLQMQSLFDKWYGESEKRTSALFSLAHKLQPCILFLDEVDALFRSRQGDDHEVSRVIKTMFMSNLDGLFENSSKILVLAATNRPQELDQALLRRLPLRIRIPLPDAKQREAITRLLLRGEQVAEDVNFEKLSKKTEGFSGSDLREVCRYAANLTMRESLAKNPSLSQRPPPISAKHMETSIDLFRGRYNSLLHEAHQDPFPLD